MPEEQSNHRAALTITRPGTEGKARLQMRGKAPDRDLGGRHRCVGAGVNAGGPSRSILQSGLKGFATIRRIFPDAAQSDHRRNATRSSLPTHLLDWLPSCRDGCLYRWVCVRWLGWLVSSESKAVSGASVGRINPGTGRIGSYAPISVMRVLVRSSTHNSTRRIHLTGATTNFTSVRSALATSMSAETGPYFWITVSPPLLLGVTAISVASSSRTV